MSTTRATRKGTFAIKMPAVDAVKMKAVPARRTTGRNHRMERMAANVAVGATWFGMRDVDGDVIENGLLQVCVGCVGAAWGTTHSSHNRHQTVPYIHTEQKRERE